MAESLDRVACRQGLESGAQAIGVDSPIVVHAAVEREYRNFFSVAFGEGGILVDVEFGERNVEFTRMGRLEARQHSLDHRARVVAEVAAGLANQRNFKSLRHVSSLGRA